MIALALVAVACGDDNDVTGTTSGTTMPPDPNTLVLQITNEGGFAPLEFLLNRAPTYALYADGTLYFQGPIAEIFPGPILPNIQQVKVSDADVALMLELVNDMGMPDIDRVFNTDAAANVADATDTVLTYRDTSGDHVFGVYALGLVDVRDDRVDLLRTLLSHLDRAAFSTPGTTSYRGERLQVFATVGTVTGDQAPRTQPWPLAQSPSELPDWGLEFRCGVIDGADAGVALDAFLGADQLTLWENGSELFKILARPLLPGEEACVQGVGGAF